MFKLFVTTVIAFAMQTVFAQGYPSQTVRLIVPFAPGGSADGLGRAMADRLGAALGQTFVVENRPGASGTIGAALVAKAGPDGYTLFLMPGTHVLGPRLMKSLPFDAFADFTPISTLVFVPTVIVVGKDQPFNTLGEMLLFGKANRGKVAVGVSEISGRLTVEAINQSGNFGLLHANYKGGGPIGIDVAGGHLPAGVVGAASIMGQYKEGRIKILAVTSPKRLASIPEVATVAEALNIPGFDLQTWYALTGPKGLPSAIVERLQSVIPRILAEPGMKEKLSILGVVAAENSTSAALSKLMRSYADINGKLLDAAGIDPE